MANYRALLDIGVLFPKTGFATNGAISGTTTAGHRGLVPFFKEGLSAGSAVGARLSAEIASTSCSRIIISSEVLSAPQNRDAVSGVTWFRDQGFRIVLVVYLRRQDLWLDSFYRERLKWLSERWRETRSIGQFWHQNGNEWLDYEARLAVWIEAVGHENTVIRSYDDVQAEGGVVSDFFRTVGVSETLLDVSAAKNTHNASLPASAMEFFRAVNSSGNSAVVYKPALMTAVHQMELFRRSAGTTVEPALFEEIKAAFSQQNEEFRKDLLTGPSERFSFFAGDGCSPLAEQAVSYADSILLLNAITGQDGRT